MTTSVLKKITLFFVSAIAYAMISGGCKENLSQTSFVEKRDTILNDEHRLIVCGQFVENDTLFFLQEYLKKWKDTLHNVSIYLEPDSNSIYYKPDFWLMRFDEEYCDEQMRQWQSNREKRFLSTWEKVSLFNLPIDWIPLHYRNGEPYVLVPCEVDYPWQVHLTDSVLKAKGFGHDLISLRKSERLSPTLYHFRLGNYDEFGHSFLHTYENGELYIHVIDQLTKASIWEYRKSGKETLYHLMIPIQSISYFKLIVCNAMLQKFTHNELDLLFDEVDVKALLEEVKSGKKTNLFNN